MECVRQTARADGNSILFNSIKLQQPSSHSAGNLRADFALDSLAGLGTTFEGEPQLILTTRDHHMRFIE